MNGYPASDNLKLTSENNVTPNDESPSNDGYFNYGKWAPSQTKQMGNSAQLKDENLRLGESVPRFQSAHSTLAKLGGEASPKPSVNLGNTVESVFTEIENDYINYSHLIWFVILIVLLFYWYKNSSTSN